MKTPRIVVDTMPERFERLMRGMMFRFGLPIVLVTLTSTMAYVLENQIGLETYLTLLFVAILLSSVLCGLLSGLLATLLAGLAGVFLPPDYLTTAELTVLVVQGVLVSTVGGTLRTVRRKANERLAANQRLEQQIVEIGDKERQRIGHDLHDGLGQHLTGIALLSETISQQLETGNQPDRAHVETITRLVSEAVGITRDLAKSLSPVTLEQDGLFAALQELADTTSTLFGIECTVEYDGSQIPLDRSRALNLYRIVQEAVNNSIRHGKARYVQIGVTCRSTGIAVKVQDDGSGLSEKTMSSPGLGLRIMQYRARMLEASLTVERASAAGGTLMTCVCPVPGVVLYGSAEAISSTAGG